MEFIELKENKLREGLNKMPCGQLRKKQRYRNVYKKNFRKLKGGSTMIKKKYYRKKGYLMKVKGSSKQVRVKPQLVKMPKR